jgi:hypothetical protein
VPRLRTGWTANNMPPVVDPWLETGCWRDVPDDHEGVRTCEADPDPRSALGLCAEHQAQIVPSASPSDSPIMRWRQKPGIRF